MDLVNTILELRLPEIYSGAGSCEYKIPSMQVCGIGFGINGLDSLPMLCINCGAISRRFVI